MAKLRKFCAYRRLERPFTRISKFRNKAFVRARPHSKVIKYTMGDQKREFQHTILLKSLDNMQVRHNSIESARLTANRTLEKQIGRTNFFFKMRIYPHHILRENPLASGAGADRMSTGMKKAFGKPVGVAAQISEDQIIAELKVDKNHLPIARKALKRFTYKLPLKTRLEEN
ncbi:MAG: 50S ribosomal protein L16 [Candidatus Woesearchaeota archaeon]